MKEVTDPVLLEELNKIEVTDPNIISQLEGKPVSGPHTEEIEDKGWPIDIKKATLNVPKSAGKLAKGIYDIGADVAKSAYNLQVPETIKGVGKTVVGGVQKLADVVVPESMRSQPTEDYRPYAEAFGGMIEDRYGGWDNFRKTVEEDPVGFLADVSTILSAGGTAAPKMALAAKAIDPFNVTLGTARKVAGSKPMAEVFGLLTGKGTQNVQEAAKATPAFAKTFASPTAGEETYVAAKKGLQQLAEGRSERYKGRLQTIENMRNAPMMDLNPINSKFNDWLNKYKIIIDDNGKLNFDKSPLKGDPGAMRDVERVQDLLNGWQGELMGPINMDSLKRQLGNFYSESGGSRAMVEDLYNTSRSQLVDRVSGYGEMVTDYERSSNLLREIEKSFSIGGQSNANSGLNRLTTAMKEDKDLRRNLLQQIKEGSGIDLPAMIAGHEMKSWHPSSLFGRSAIFTEITMAAFHHNPMLAAGILASSPHLVADFYKVLAGVHKASKATTLGRQPLYQMGNIPTE